MKTQRLLLAALITSACLVLQDASVGHGGTYRGPGDTVPPGGGGGSGGSGPGTPAPSGPAHPGGPVGTPGGGILGGPFAGPTSGPGNAFTGGADVATTDLTTWPFWWGFNKEPYLNLRDAINTRGVVSGTDGWWIGRDEKDLARDTLRPSEEKIRAVVVPALLKALAEERQNDIVTGCMIALAKIGDAKDEQGESRFEAVIEEFLADSVQEISETAAIALGILANEASIPILTDLALDRPKGHEVVGSTSVPYRTRAFATFGLGLIGNRCEDNETRRAIAETLIRIVELPRQATRDLEVAAIASLGVVPVDPASSPSMPSGQGEETPDAAYWARSRETQVRYLLDFFTNERGEHYLTRAHAPRALARLIDGVGDEALRLELVDALIETIGPRSQQQDEVVQSALLALGQLGDCDADEHDAKIRKAVASRIKDAGDQQAKHFAVIALAQIGGRPGTNVPDAGYPDIKRTLTRQLAVTGQANSRVKPWLGLALGVMQRARTDATGDLPDSEVASVLRTALADCRSPMDVGAYCIGVGIAKDVEAKEIVLAKLESLSDDEARGYAAVALGLMDARDAVEPIQKIVRESKYRPELLKQAAIALGLLGDKALVDSLIEMLASARGLATQAAISSALGFIGDSRSVDPLVEMLQDPSITASARGFAAVALGIVADKETLPWNAKLSVDVNYRANTTTLTGDNGTGILDIL